MREPSGRPAPGEFADYARDDIAAVPGDDAIAALAALAPETAALFRSLAPVAERGLSYAPGKWPLKVVLGHLIDDERIFAYRILCLARGEEHELPGFDQETYAEAAGFAARALESLLAEYAEVRGATLALLRHLPDGAWQRRGRVNGYEASVRGLAFHVAGHELHHLRIVRDRYASLAG